MVRGRRNDECGCEMRDQFVTVTLLPPRFKQPYRQAFKHTFETVGSHPHTRSNDQLWNLRFLAQETQCMGTEHKNGTRKKRIRQEKRRCTMSWNDELPAIQWSMTLVLANSLLCTGIGTFREGTWHSLSLWNIEGR